MDIIDTRPTTARLDVPVLVVGAGPAGLVTAIGLARHGVRSLVIERHASTSIFPRATGVSVRSMEIFRGWGIDSDIRRGSWRVKPVGAHVTTLDDPAPVEYPLGFSDATAAAVSPATAAVSPQDHIEPVLVEHYRSLGRGEIRFSTELVAFEQDADRGDRHDPGSGERRGGDRVVRLPRRRGRPSQHRSRAGGHRDGRPR